MALSFQIENGEMIMLMVLNIAIGCGWNLGTFCSKIKFSCGWSSGGEELRWIIIVVVINDASVPRHITKLLQQVFDLLEDAEEW